MADLRQKIEAECEHIESAIRELPNHAKLTELSTLELAGVGALLASCYNGIENILKQALLAKDVAIPAGGSWHRDLLNLAVEHRVLSKRVRTDLAQFLAFRHFFNHAYGFEVDASRLQPLVEDLSTVCRQFLRGIRKQIKK